MEDNLGIYERGVLDITGLIGRDQEQLLEGLLGLRAADYQAYFRGSQIIKGDNRNLIKNGIYYLPEDRFSHSLFPDSPIWENMVFGAEDRHPEFLSLKRWKALFFPKRRAVGSCAGEIVGRPNIVRRGSDQRVREPSGGNQRKACVDRALTSRLGLLYIGGPTRDIDIYSKELILKWTLKINQEYNTTVVMVPGELEELVCICSRIMIIYQGKVHRVFENDIGPEELTLALYGREPDEA